MSRDVHDVRADSMLVALYESGETFESFLGDARARRDAWVKHWEQGRVPTDALAAARAIPGRWRLLVIAVDGCSDSVNTIPYLARLSEQVPSIELRVITPARGQSLQEAHRTPDGRAATPTVVLLDAAGDIAGCWIERPAELQEMAMRARAARKLEEFVNGKQAWYDADAGASTVREVVSMISAAASGGRQCGAPPAKTP